MQPPTILGNFLLLDISCQQLGDECKLGMNVVGAGDTFLKIYISVGNNK